MKRKEITKFLAVLLSATMIAGSGTPIAAAEFVTDVTEDVAVRDVEDDAEDAEAADEFGDGAQTATEVTENSAAVDLFSDAADTPTASSVTFDAAVNDAVGTVTMEGTETIGSKTYNLVTVTFKKSKLRDTNTVTLGITGLGESDEANVYKKVRPNGIPNGTQLDKNDNGKYTDELTYAELTGDTSIFRYCQTTLSGGYPFYYKIQYTVIDDTVAKQELQLTGQLFNTDKGYTTEVKTATLTDKTANAGGKVGNVPRVDLFFESSEGLEDAPLYIKLMPTAEKGAKIAIGNTCDKNGLTDLWTENGDGSYTYTAQTTASSYGRINKGKGPEQGKKGAICEVTHADGTVNYYYINVIRKGYAAATARHGLSEETPSDGIWGKCDPDTGEFKVNTPIQMLPMWMGIQAYDDDGVMINVYGNSSISLNPDYKGDWLWVDDSGIIHTKGAGASGDALIVKIVDKTYPMYVKALYNNTTSDRAAMLKTKATDGTTTLTDEVFKDEDDFAALFPEKDKANAKELYNLIVESNAALAANTWDSTVTGTDCKFWDENCDSAHLDKILALAPQVWANVYGLQDAKDALAEYADADHAPADKQATIKAKVVELQDQLTADYKTGQIKSFADVQQQVAAAKAEINKVNPKIDNCQITLEETEYIYDGTAKTPAVTVKDGEDVVASENYEVSYDSNTKVGVASVTVTGKEAYSGSKTVEFTIKTGKQEITGVQNAYSKTEGDADFALEVKAADGAVFTYASDNAAVAAVDDKGTVSLKGAGTAVITIKASAENYEDAELKVTVTVAAKPQPTATPVPTVTPAPTETPAPQVQECTITLKKTTYSVIEGRKAFKLNAKTDAGASLTYKSSKKAVATVDKNGKITVKAPGRTVITVTASAQGKQTKTCKITINVKPSVKLVSAVKASAKSIQVTWKRNKKASGYQVVAATDKAFKKNVKKVTVKSNKTLKATVKGLKSGKTYYVRIRSYKKVKGGNVYGNWTKTKTVKAK